MSTHPPIKVTCVCGQRFAAKDTLAGKTVKCPRCGAPLEIPQQAARPCPSCRAEMPPGAVLCIECGYSHKLGRRVESELNKTEETLTDESSADHPSQRSGKKKYLWILAAGVGVLMLFGIAWVIAQPLKTFFAVYYCVSGLSFLNAGMYLGVVCNPYRNRLIHFVFPKLIAFDESAREQKGLIPRWLLNRLLLVCSAAILLMNVLFAISAMYAFGAGETREALGYLFAGVVLLCGGHAVGVFALVQYFRGN